MSDAKKLASGVAIRVSQERVDGQWERIATRLPSAPRAFTPLRWVVASGAVAVCASVLWYATMSRETQQPWARSVVRSNEDAVDFSVGERSHIELSPSSEVALLPGRKDRIALELAEGSAFLSVEDEDGRRLSLRSGPFEIVAKQSAVRVTRDVGETGERVKVDVREGSVDVLREGESAPVHLVAGEHWSAFAAYANEETAQEVALEAARNKVFDEVEKQAVAGSPVADQVDPMDEADAVLTSEKASSRRRRGSRGPTQAAVLFDQANVARRAGQLNDAAELYERVMSGFPRDRRAALSAFELGRIRMDVLGDPKGAVTALERALVLDSKRAFAEDALARLALANEVVRDAAGCKKARELYLSRYPEGVHAESVARRCTGL